MTSYQLFFQPYKTSRLEAGWTTDHVAVPVRACVHVHHSAYILHGVYVCIQVHGLMDGCVLCVYVRMYVCSLCMCMSCVDANEYWM